MGHACNFDASELVGRGDGYTARQTKAAWRPTKCSVKRQINQPAPYLILGTFRLGDRHGMEQPEPPTISAVNDGWGRTAQSETPAVAAPQGSTGVTAAGGDQAKV
ncbi:unnamed protein product [Schistocephalus solidus]|uniref:Transposase n=1 Tax=Schistocephalus solidus TaxID=70667 RepID=A0A183TKC2_SCHSO|nr:unnamed protein product [Schistocephalus solidus]